MLSRSRRLSKDHFALIFQKGRLYRSNTLSLRVYSPPEGGLCRFSFVVPAKVAKGAVLRNKIKRRGRHIIAKKLLELRTGSWGVFLIGPALTHVPFPYFEAEVLKILKQANLFSS